MLAPSLASAMAMPWPMPEVEPVMTAVLPLRDIAILFLRSIALRWSGLGPSCRKAAALPMWLLIEGVTRSPVALLLERAHGCLLSCLPCTGNPDPAWDNSGGSDDTGSETCRNGSSSARGSQARRHLPALQGSRRHALPLRPGSPACRRQLRHRQGRPR